MIDSVLLEFIDSIANLIAGAFFGGLAIGVLYGLLLAWLHKEKLI